MAESELQRIARDLQELVGTMPGTVAEIHGHIGFADRLGQTAADYRNRHPEIPDVSFFCNRIIARADEVTRAGHASIAQIRSTQEVGTWWVEDSVTAGAPSTGSPPSGWTPAAKQHPVRAEPSLAPALLDNADAQATLAGFTPSITTADARQYIVRQESERPWLNAADGQPDEILRAIAIIDARTGHALERHDG